MAVRRPMGSLEADVLACLWKADHPLTPAEVRDQLQGELAYTTVATILVRLSDKSLVSRERSGKVYLYAPKIQEAYLAARRMHDALKKADNRREALSRFVDTLTTRETNALRRILEDNGEGL